MSAGTVTAQWVTAADADRRRHLAVVDGAQTWRALCGTELHQLDDRHVIPRRCLKCLDAARRDGVEIAPGTATQ